MGPLVLDELGKASRSSVSVVIVSTRGGRRPDSGAAEAAHDGTSDGMADGRPDDSASRCARRTAGERAICRIVAAAAVRPSAPSTARLLTSYDIRTSWRCNFADERQPTHKVARGIWPKCRAFCARPLPLHGNRRGVGSFARKSIPGRRRRSIVSATGLDVFDKSLQTTNAADARAFRTRSSGGVGKRREI